MQVTSLIEYCQEQETAAIANARKTTSNGKNFDPADNVGRNLNFGIRYNV